MKSNGFSSIQVLLLLLVLSLFSAGTGAGISLTRSFFHRHEALQTELETLRDEITALMVELENDPTPESDSMTDPVWDYIEEKSGDFRRCELTDLSSRLNPNWLRTLFLERTDMKKFLLIGITPDMIKERRAECGYELDIRSAYSELIDPEALHTYFTPCSYLNVNTAYEFALQGMYETLTGDSAGAARFHEYIAGALQEKRIISAADFAAAAGNDYKAVFPIISTLPEMNIHFIPEFLLEQVLLYPYGGEAIENNSALFNLLLSARMDREISPEELRGLIPADGQQERVFHHLGTKTWFWKVDMAADRTSVEAIIVCVPADSCSHTEYRYRLYSFSEVPGEKED